MQYGREYTNIRYSNDAPLRDSTMITSPTSSTHSSNNSLYGSMSRLAAANPPLTPLALPVPVPLVAGSQPVVNRESKRTVRSVSDAHLPR